MCTSFIFSRPGSANIIVDPRAWVREGAPLYLPFGVVVEKEEGRSFRWAEFGKVALSPHIYLREERLEETLTREHWHVLVFSNSITVPVLDVQTSKVLGIQTMKDMALRAVVHPSVFRRGVPRNYRRYVNAALQRSSYFLSLVSEAKGEVRGPIVVPMPWKTLKVTKHLREAYDYFQV